MPQDDASPVPRVQTVTIQTKPGQTVAIRTLSDLHLDESLCDRAYLIQQAKTDRQRFGDVYALCFGDVSNIVFHTDQKRFMPSVLRDDLANKDRFIKASVRSCAAFLASLRYKWLLLSEGNHEHSATKHYGADVVGDLADELGCLVGGISGVLDIRITCRPGTWSRLRIVYAHGNWGGEAKGYHAAKRFAFQHDDWDIFCYGHNHKCGVNPETRVSVNGPHLKETTVFMMDCGSAARSYSANARATHYGELKGYTREPIMSPLVLYTPRLLHGKIKSRLSVCVEREQ